MKNTKFISITKKNIKLAIKTVKEIFPYEVSPDGIFLPAEEYKSSLVEPLNKISKFYIVKHKNRIVGITGYNYNYHKTKHDELWLGYFGLKEKYRGNGLGKKILLRTLGLMKKFNKDLRVIKLYTSNRRQEISSHHLYRCVGFKLYAHRNTKPFHTYYFKMEV